MLVHEAANLALDRLGHVDDVLFEQLLLGLLRAQVAIDLFLHHSAETLQAFLDREIAALKDLRVVVALGKIGFDAYVRYARRAGIIISTVPYIFGHSAEYKMGNGIHLLASFHPSMQNTNTGKLTEKMFADVFKRARKLAALP